MHIPVVIKTSVFFCILVKTFRLCGVDVRNRGFWLRTNQLGLPRDRVAYTIKSVALLTMPPNCLRIRVLLQIHYENSRNGWHAYSSRAA